MHNGERSSTEVSEETSSEPCSHHTGYDYWSLVTCATLNGVNGMYTPPGWNEENSRLHSRITCLDYSIRNRIVKCILQLIQLQDSQDTLVLLTLCTICYKADTGVYNSIYLE